MNDRIAEVSDTVNEGLAAHDEHDDMNEAERLALVVGAAYGTALAERDAARALAVHLEQENAELLDLLQFAVAQWPETTWATDSVVKDHLIQGIEALEAVESPETPDDPKVDR